MLGTLLTNGIGASELTLFTQMTPPPGSAGGLINAIFGSLAMTAIATLIGTPTGILAGTFLAEYGHGSRLGEVVRFINDILLSRAVDHHRPVRLRGARRADGPFLGLGRRGRAGDHHDPGHRAHHRGHAAAWCRTRCARPPPRSGAPKWKIIVTVTYRSAVQGMLTGVLLAVARISGETAPLLFTALNNQFWSTDLNAPMANLPVVIFQFAMSPYADWQTLAWARRAADHRGDPRAQHRRASVSPLEWPRKMSVSLATTISPHARTCRDSPRRTPPSPPFPIKVQIRNVGFHYGKFHALKNSQPAAATTGG